MNLLAYCLLAAAFLQCYEARADWRSRRDLQSSPGEMEFTPIAVIQGFVMGARGQACPDGKQIVRRLEDCDYALRMFTTNRPDQASVEQYFEDSSNYQVGCSLHLGYTGIYNDMHEFSSNAPNFFYSSAESYPVCYEEGIIPDADEGLRIEYDYWTGECHLFWPDECPSGYEYYRTIHCGWGGWFSTIECRRQRYVCATGTLYAGRTVNGVQTRVCILRTNFGESNTWNPEPVTVAECDPGFTSTTRYYAPCETVSWHPAEFELTANSQLTIGGIAMLGNSQLTMRMTSDYSWSKRTSLILVDENGMKIIGDDDSIFTIPGKYDYNEIELLWVEQFIDDTITQTFPRGLPGVHYDPADYVQHREQETTLRLTGSFNQHHSDWTFALRTYSEGGSGTFVTEYPAEWPCGTVTECKECPENSSDLPACDASIDGMSCSYNPIECCGEVYGYSTLMSCSYNGGISSPWMVSERMISCPACESVPAFEVTSGSQYCHVDGDCITDGADSYADHEDCIIIVHAEGILRVLEWEIEDHDSCAYDAFSVGDEKFCGSQQPEGVLVPAGSEISWSSDYSVTFGGWKVCLERTELLSAQGQIPCDSPHCIGQRRSLQTYGRKL